MEGKAKRVQIIRATKGEQEYGKIRMAAYCRVSTDSSDQANSFMAQMQYYNDYIRQNPNMVLVDIYADEGITGTSIEKRTEFKRLLRDCENHKIDRVIVKSVTRFARNSLECLEAIRTMQSCGVSVYFETDNIDTSHMNSELLLYIKSAFAQGEALAASARMQTSIRMKMEEGSYVATHAPFGYRYESGELIVVPEEAEVVREIFDWYLSGKGFDAITAVLNRRYGGWNSNRVRYILTNEKYIGDTLWQKTYTPHMLPLRNVPNNGEKAKYCAEGTQQAIVSREDFGLVRQMIAERSQKGKPPKKTPFFPVGVVCRHCGWSFSRKGSSPHLIACSKKGLSGTKCPSRSYSYDELAGAFVRMYHTLRQNEHGILDQAVLQLQSYKAKRTCQNEQIAGIDADIARLSEQSEMYAKLLAEKAIDQVTYAEKCDIYKRKISELRTRRRKLLSEDEDERCVEGLRELKRKLHDMPPRILSATRNQITAITKKIYAEEDGSLTFVLCGELELNVRMETLCH